MLYESTTLGVLAPGPIDYERREPQQTLLYQIIEQYYPKFLEHLSQSGKTIPQYVQNEFEAYLKCGCLEHGFLRVKCESCHHERLVAFSCKYRGFCPSCGARRMADSSALLVDNILPNEPIRQWVLSVPFPLRWLFASQPQIMSKVLEVVIRGISSYLIKKAGFTNKTAKTGAVTLIQRFGSALNLNIHFHMLFLDGVYVITDADKVNFQAITAPTNEEINKLLLKISTRIGDFLERRGLIERDVENSYLAMDADDDNTLHQMQASSITYRIAVGPQAGKKVFTLQSLPSNADSVMKESAMLAKANGFSLHAGVSAASHERGKLERICRYITRPAVAISRLKLISQGKISYELKTPYRNGTTHVIFEPMDFIARLASLVPKPRVHLARFHGVFAPNSKYRSLITKASKQKQKSDTKDLMTEGEGKARQSWARRLARVFNIDITICSHCQGKVKVIACIEEPDLIKKILNHIDYQPLKNINENEPLNMRAPPAFSLG